jgi:hypothetical protein
MLIALSFLCCAGAGAGGVAVLLLLDLVILTSSGIGVFLLRVAGCMSGGVYRLLLDLVILTSSGIGIFLLPVAGCMSGGVYRAAPMCLPNPLSGRNHPGPIFLFQCFGLIHQFFCSPLVGSSVWMVPGSPPAKGSSVWMLPSSPPVGSSVWMLPLAASCPTTLYTCGH